MALSAYEELKGWQAGIGSILGFFALMVAALWNFHLNRRRDSRLRTDEALSVAAALYGEILLLRREVAALARAVAVAHINRGTKRYAALTIDQHLVEAHKLSEPQLFKALASKIGLLPPDLVIAITEFHQNCQEARMWLPLLIDNKERGYSYTTSAVLEPACKAVRNISLALHTIESMLALQRPAEDLDLGQADFVIDMENKTLGPQ
jgi:hypothetical protein